VLPGGMWVEDGVALRLAELLRQGTLSRKLSMAAFAGSQPDRLRAPHDYKVRRLLVRLRGSGTPTNPKEVISWPRSRKPRRSFTARRSA
jgi:hypothetical protein